MFSTGFSTWHWLILLGLAVWAVGVGRLLKRLGYSPWWGLLAVIPFFLPVGVWLLLAVGRWPIEESQIADVFSGGPAPEPPRRIKRGLP